MPITRRHHPWVTEDTELLRAYIAQGGSAATAAIRFKRSESAIRAYANDLGLKFPTIKQRRARMMGSNSVTQDSYR